MTEKTKLKDFLFREVPLKVLLSLISGKKSITQVYREVQTTYSYTLKILKKLEEFGLVTYDWTNGREKNYFLTEKGRRLIEMLKPIINYE